MCLAHKEKHPAQDSIRGRGGQRGRGRYFKGRGADILKEKRQTYIAFAAKEMDHMMPLHASYHGTKLSRKETNRKVKLKIQTKVKHLNPFTILRHNVTLEQMKICLMLHLLLRKMIGCLIQEQPVT